MQSKTKGNIFTVFYELISKLQQIIAFTLIKSIFSYVIDESESF